MTSRIYLDNAATSFPKPEAVYAAMDHYHRSLGAAVGRGAYQAAMDVQSVVRRCRKRAAELLGAESSERVLFTFNGTDSLNIALHGLLKPGEHVVTSAMEHNSVLRPLRWLQEQRGVEVTRVPADANGANRTGGDAAGDKAQHPVGGDDSRFQCHRRTTADCRGL